MKNRASGTRSPIRTAAAVLCAAALVAGSGVLGATNSIADPQAVSMAEVVAATSSTSAIAGLHPADIADAYGLTGGVTGLTVGIVIPYDTPSLESDLAVYRSAFGLPACTTANGCFTKVDQNGGTSLPAANADWGLEASLDVQSVSASCPACKIMVVETANAGMASLGTGINTAVRLGAAAVSMSWGMQENSSASYYSGRYFTHPGVPLIAATGDDGYPQASMPATLPNVIAVGGTTLSHTTASGAARIDAAAPDAVVVSNGDVSPATGLTVALEHTAALAHARTELARARARATTATKAVAAAKARLAADRKALTRATAKYHGAVERAKRSGSAAHTHSLAAAKKTYTARQRAVARATAAVTRRTTALAAATRSVRSLTVSVAGARAVVIADQHAASRTVSTTSTGTASTSPVTPEPTAPTPAPTPAPVPTVSSAPVAVQTPSPVTSSAPTAGTTSAPAPVQTPAPTSTATSNPTPAASVTSTPANVPPTASFGSSPSGLSVSFDGAASSDSDGTIVGYAWDFGDGSTASGVTTTHTYPATGSYTATLTVTDNGGATASTSASVTVTAPVVVSAGRGTWIETAWSGGGSGCSAFVAKPAWQTDTACAMRTVADIAAVGDPATGLAVYDTYGTTAYTATGWMVIGGTSLAAPLIAGMIVRSGHAANYTNASPFYANRSAFWDITSGSNGSCAGSAVCTAGVGYDGPTGLGTPKSLASF